MTSGFIKINFSDGKPFFNIWVSSDSDPKEIKREWDTFLSYIYLDEASSGFQSRLNWNYLATNFMRFLSEKYLNKTSFNSNRVSVAPDSWADNAIYQFEITPIKDKYSDFNCPISKAIIFNVLKGEDDFN